MQTIRLSGSMLVCVVSPDMASPWHVGPPAWWCGRTLFCCSPCVGTSSLFSERHSFIGSSPLTVPLPFTNTLHLWHYCLQVSIICEIYIVCKEYLQIYFINEKTLPIPVKIYNSYFDSIVLSMKPWHIGYQDIQCLRSRSWHFVSYVLSVWPILLTCFLVYSVLHCVGHAINFYHISTQTANDLTCLFRDFFHA